MQLDFLYRGTPGHPLHPPLTDATIGIYSFATTAITGFADWLRIERGTSLWRTAIAHMVAMVSAAVFFLIAIGAGYGDGIDGLVTDGAFILTLLGFAMLTLGGWLGGTIVFHYGMRVLNLVEEPASRATSPIPHPQEEAAEN